MLTSLVCLSFFTTVVFGETTTRVPYTHKPHPSHEPSEHSTFTFVYEPTTHKFAISTGGSCYIFTLTADERIAIHTDSGMKALEVKLAGLIEIDNKTLTNKEDLDNHLQRACAHHVTTYYIMVQ